MRRVAVDFDGVIMRRDGSHKPIKGARRGLEELQRQGYTVLVHSTRALSRAGESFIRGWMAEHSMPFDDVGSRKLDADRYLDDKAEHFTAWGNVGRQRGLSVMEAYELAKVELGEDESDA